MRYFRWITLLLSVTLAVLSMPTLPDAQAPATVLAQEAATCSSVVVDALQTVGSACTALGRNEACYGNRSISAVLSDSALSFEDSGDIVELTALETLITRPADPDSGDWGVAVIDLAADLPESATDNVRMVLFGGLELEATAPADMPDVTCTYTNPNANGINMRTQPDILGRSVDVLDSGDNVEVYGQSADGEWLRSSRGWVNLNVGEVAACNLDELPVLDSAESLYSQPFQAIMLSPGEAGTCEDAPDGLLIQAPTGETANVLVNGVEIRVGSTAFVTLDESALVIANLDNEVSVTTQAQTAIVPVGAGVSITLDADGNAGETPGGLLPLPDAAQNLPVDLLQTLLPEPIEVPPTFTFTPPSTPGATTQPPAQDILGQIGVCGGCADCGPYPSSECILLQDGTCTWDPATCRGVPAGDIKPTVALSASSFTCASGQARTVTATLTPSPVTGAGLSFISYNESPPGIVAPTPQTPSGNSVDIPFFCDNIGFTVITVFMVDTALNTGAASFEVTVTP